MVAVDKGDWDKSKGPTEMHEFNLKWLEACQRLLRPNGTIWVSGTFHNIHSVGYAMQVLGYKILNEIVWQKTNPPPCLSCRYFTHASETILWAAKSDKSKHVFQYADMRAENEGKQMLSVWKMGSPRKIEKQYGKHTTQKPVALLDRIIRASTREGDLVLDPFAGSGTTIVVGAGLKRRCVGIELDDGYFDLMKRRATDTKVAQNPETPEPETDKS
jgi:site-specific DNA-methyltransferase (adenine-specific)